MRAISLANSSLCGFCSVVADRNVRHFVIAKHMRHLDVSRSSYSSTMRHPDSGALGVLTGSGELEREAALGGARAFEPVRAVVVAALRDVGAEHDGAAGKDA